MSEKTNVKLPFFGVPKLLPYTRKYRKRIISMVLMGIVASLIDSIFPLFNRYAIDHFIGEKTLDTIGIFVVLFLLVLAVQVILNYISVYWAGTTEMDVDRDLRDASFNHLQELSFAYFNQNNVGYIHARVMSDTGKIGELVAWRLMDIIWNGSYLLFVFAVMLGINAHLTMYIAVLVPIAVVAVSYFQKHLVTLNRRIREINSKITGNFNEGITGAKSIKTLVVEETIGDDFKKDTLDMPRKSPERPRWRRKTAAMLPPVLYSFPLQPAS